MLSIYFSIVLTRGLKTPSYKSPWKCNRVYFLFLLCKPIHSSLLCYIKLLPIGTIAKYNYENSLFSLFFKFYLEFDLDIEIDIIFKCISNTLTFKRINIIQSSNKYSIVYSFICWSQNELYMKFLDTLLKITKRRVRL